MTAQRPALLACLLTLAAALQTGTAPTPNGPYNGYFIPDGVGLKKPLPTEAGVLKADSRWTIHCWIKADNSAAAGTLIAGFGDPAGEAAAQRFLTARAGNVAFRAGNVEVMTDVPLRPGAWQFLAVTFDGATLRLYVDGAESAARALPAYASDNFVSLLPGERRALSIETPAAAARGGMRVELKGWNLRGASALVRR